MRELSGRPGGGRGAAAGGEHPASRVVDRDGIDVLLDGGADPGVLRRGPRCGVTGHNAPMSEDAAAVDRAQRVLEEGISTDFAQAMSYGAYLDLDTLLSAQHPRSRPAQHDELLFIVQHQVAELWMKLLLHELHSARALLAADDLVAGAEAAGAGQARAEAARRAVGRARDADPERVRR